ncbi:MAG: L-arabinose isomerase, partial [Spirochaetales bacterium]|nr:L-arabinose isomerase [Spirochaetales bacterium]
MRKGKEKLFWFLTGSQELYGEETLRQVVSNSKVIVEELNKGGILPRKLLFKP